MSFEVADRILELLKNSRNIHTVDITGGAPEMHQAFRYLIRRIRAEIPHVQRIIDRCNLTVLGLLSQLDLLGFLRDHEVDVIASLPCYMEENVDQQRGNTAFRRSISGLRELNSVGYGLPRSPLRLDLVYNPLGPYLPPDQLELEVQYHDYLYHNFGIFFHRLICITNMPIKRFLSDLVKAGQYEAYMNLLVNAYNPATLEGLMCRDQVHVSYDGQLYDCDFNYALEMPMMENRDGDRDLQTVFKLKRSFDELTCTLIRTGPHCFGCTAGCGSSCTGAIMKGT
jgi:radical SAM/Cys-rich protein